MMAMNFVENVDGKAKVCWKGAIVMLSALLLACAVIPAVGFWLAYGFGTLVSTALVIGFIIASLSFGAILGRNLGLPLDKLPIRTP